MEFDNLDDLRILLATAQTGGLTSAGKRCGLSTAAVSAAIKRLERTLGVRLFERTTRCVRPTPQGEVMIDHARRALELVAQGQALVQAETQQALSGPVRITAASMLVHEVLARWLAALTEQNPHLRIELLISDLQLDLVREGIDLALRNGPLPDSSQSARLITPARRIACASPAYLARHGTPTHPEELARHQCVVYQVRGRPMDQWVFTPRGQDGPPVAVQVDGRLSCTDASIAQLWALEGHGVLYQSELGLTTAFAQGRLVPLFDQHQGEPAPLYAVLPSRHYTPARVVELMDRLADLFAQTPRKPHDAKGSP